MYALHDPTSGWREINGAFASAEVQYPGNWIDLASADEIAAAGLIAIVEVTRPSGVRVLGSVLDDQDGRPTRRWLTEPLTPEEVRAATVPESVSPRQLRLALLGAGLLDKVNAFVAGGAVPPAARISWEYATAYRRDDPMLNAMAAQLQPPMTDAQVDQLFIAAAAIA